MPDKILLAVDGSEFSEHAFNFYNSVVHREDNEVIVLHCPDISSEYAKQLSTKLFHFKKREEQQPTSQENFEKLMEEEKQKWTKVEKKYMQLIQENKIKGKWKVHQSHKPGEAIVSEAASEKVDMIVMGTRGLGTIRRTIMGSVSDYVVHHATCPVMVCRK
jgi:nucleotide-binding universal stress UspA family protein